MIPAIYPDTGGSVMVRNFEQYEKAFRSHPNGEMMND